jgi:chaperonin cofactor prefoldin
MQKNDKILTRKIFQYEQNLKLLATYKRKLSVKLIAMKKSLKELEENDSSKVLQKIDSIVMYRDTQVVLKDTQDEIVTLENDIREIDKKYDKGVAELKKMASGNHSIL